LPHETPFAQLEHQILASWPTQLPRRSHLAEDLTGFAICIHQ